MESYFYTFDRPRRADIWLPMMSWAGPETELRWLDPDEVLGRHGVSFVIPNITGDVFTAGVYAGSLRNRDVPLERARIQADDRSPPEQIEYADGAVYKVDSRFGCIVEISPPYFDSQR